MHWGAEPPLLQASESEERSHHRAVMEAMQVIGFSAEEMGSVRRILAAILHLVSLLPGLGHLHPLSCPRAVLVWGGGRLASDNAVTELPLLPAAWAVGSLETP